MSGINVVKRPLIKHFTPLFFLTNLHSNKVSDWINKWYHIFFIQSAGSSDEVMSGFPKTK